jgi:hypothetical protein
VAIHIDGVLAGFGRVGVRTKFLDKWRFVLRAKGAKGTVLEKQELGKQKAEIGSTKAETLKT